MPVINIALGQTSADVKKELISSLTSSAAAITGIPESAFIVLVEEYPAESIGVGGRTLKEIKESR